MKRALNIGIIRQEIGVPPIDNTGVVTKPAANLVQTDAGTDKQAGKSPSESMWSYPFEITSFNMFVKRTGEVITIPVAAMLDFGPEHEWFSQPILVKKRLKRARKGNGSLLAVFEIHSGGLA